MMYLLCLNTGLRRRELRSLSPDAFDFSTKPAAITLTADKSKRRQADQLLLPSDVATVFQKYVADKLPSEPIWPGSWWRQSAEMIRRDLEAADIPVEDGQGRAVDFHGQRTTYITNLSRSGIPPALAQKLARHSSLKLTLGTYTQVELNELGAAVNQLPQLTRNVGRETVSNDDGLADLDLEELSAKWRKLSTTTREQIMALARSASW